MGYLDSTGLARLIENIESHTVSLTTFAIPLTPSGWQMAVGTDGEGGILQTVTATGVTSSSLIVVNPTPESMDIYSSCSVACVDQSTNSLTFACATEPSEVVDIIVIAMNGGKTLYGVASDTENLSVSKSCASAGETITVTNLTNEAQSWTLNGVDQTDISANGTATFTMPSERVVVDNPRYVVTVDNSEFDGMGIGFKSFGIWDGISYTNETGHYIISSYSKVNTYHAGETVCYATDYNADMIGYQPSENYSQTVVGHVAGNIYRTFIMPNHDVTIITASSIN